jgi:hypothetical protein
MDIISKIKLSDKEGNDLNGKFGAFQLTYKTEETNAGAYAEKSDYHEVTKELEILGTWNEADQAIEIFYPIGSNGNKYLLLRDYKIEKFEPVDLEAILISTLHKQK